MKNQSKCPYHAFLQTTGLSATNRINPRLKALTDILRQRFSFLLSDQQKYSLSCPEIIRLFGEGNIDKIERTPIRPLGPLSDANFVRGELKTEEIEEYLKSFDIIAVCKSLEEHEQHLALFDLKFLYSKLAYQGHKSDTLRKNIKILSEELHVLDGPVPLYTDLIFLNPSSDVRTFLGAEAGFQEYHFYLGHTLIEKEFEEVIVYLESLILALHEGTDINIPDLKNSIKNHFEKAFAYMRMYNKSFKKDAFNELRPFFNIPDDLLEPGENPIGASGVNTATMVIMSMLMQGEYLKGTDYMKGFGGQDIGMHIFKDRGRLEVLRGDAGYISLIDLAREKGRKDVLKLCEELNQNMIYFLTIHLGTVKKFLPEAYNNPEALGTGGFPLQESLVGSIQQKQNFGQELTKLLDS